MGTIHPHLRQHSTGTTRSADRRVGRPRLAAAAAVAAAALGVAVVAPTGAGATPAPHHPSGHGSAAVDPSSISSVRHYLADLARRNDQIVEQFDQAQVAFTRAQSAARTAARTAAAAQRRLASAEVEFGALAAEQYEGGTFSATGALLSSSSGASYLDQLDTMSLVSAHNAQVVAEYAGARDAAATAQRSAHDAYQHATATRNALAERKLATVHQIDKYKQVLAHLTAQQRALAASHSDVTTSQVTHLSAAASQAARIAVNFALAQVGKPYVFGAAGPDAYDCSGLTMQAWAAAGVALPHSALEQYNYGRHVSFDQLQPGDLLFFYHPIGHVAIYIGNGLMVSAPEPGEDVMVVRADAFGSDFAGATRLVG